MGCADAVPRTQKQVLKRSGEPYAATNGTYGFGEGGTGDPEKGDRPLLYNSSFVWSENVVAHPVGVSLAIALL